MTRSPPTNREVSEPPMSGVPVKSQGPGSKEGSETLSSDVERVTDALWPLADWGGDKANAREAALSAIAAMSPSQSDGEV